MFLLYSNTYMLIRRPLQRGHPERAKFTSVLSPARSYPDSPAQEKNESGPLSRIYHKPWHSIQHYMLCCFLCFCLWIPGCWICLLVPEKGRNYILHSVAGLQLIACFMAAVHKTCQNWLYSGYHQDVLDMCQATLIKEMQNKGRVCGVLNTLVL